MAQLPPRIPNMPEKRPSWADEFVQYSAARRGAHRRSVSDPIAFLEVDDDDFNPGPGRNPGFDPDEGHNHLLMSMLSCDDAPVPQPTVGRHDDARMVKNEPPAGEDQRLPGKDEDTASLKNQETSSSADTVISDQKRLKRILANRQSAQRSRVRKLQYISELERSVTTLQSEVSALSPRVAFLDHQRLILNVDNSALKQRIAALAQDKVFKDAHQEALRREIERLQRLYYQQNLNKPSNNRYEEHQKRLAEEAGSSAERKMLMGREKGNNGEEEEEGEEEDRILQMRDGGRFMVQVADHHQLQAFT